MVNTTLHNTLYANVFEIITTTPLSFIASISRSQKNKQIAWSFTGDINELSKDIKEHSKGVKRTSVD